MRIVKLFIGYQWAVFDPFFDFSVASKELLQVDFGAFSSHHHILRHLRLLLHPTLAVVTPFPSCQMVLSFAQSWSNLTSMCLVEWLVLVDSQRTQI